MNNRQKQSLIFGALTSTFGIFLSKAIGLLYASPFSLLASESNIVFYSNAYSLYDILLNLCTAGIPFAIATMIAKYNNKQDYKTAILINKLASTILISTGIIVGLIFLILSKPLAIYILGNSATIQDINYQHITFITLTLSIFIIPYLSGIRGFLQGLKEFERNSFSLVLEQLSRVIFLLGGGFLFVVVLKQQQITSIYIGILAAFVGGVFAIIYLLRYNNQELNKLKELSINQNTIAIDHKELIKEMLYFGIPYVLVIILGNSTNIVNSIFFLPTMEYNNIDYNQAKLMLGILQFNVVKLNSIPQVLALGFSAGIVPFLTVAYENKDYNKIRDNIKKIIIFVCYIAMPVSFFLFVLGEPIYYLMYGSTNLQLGSDILKASSLIAFSGTIAPICTTLLMTLRLRKKIIIFLLINFISKLVLFFPLVIQYHFYGAIVSSFISSLFNIFLSLYILRKIYKVYYREVVTKLLIILLGLGSIYIIVYLLNIIIPFTYITKIGTLVFLTIYSLISILVYILITSLFKLPQKLLSYNNHNND